MPQLFPMNWNLLCTLFMTITILSIMLVYFIKMPKLETTFLKKNNLQKIWKW
uniref:ATP synthase F0 subunit 8 n=1 Tax=Ornithodoros compactus TaxID=1580120 RepID=UPI0007394D03|nr:ATP synthase F0 subunit 8 [Ornithodoros compactus]AIZ58556.1 ATP synthase F0 subunit 8 [Ornithodoros compactus]QLD97209.1 ATP synthase F0 subunit 8 [Ornithodoros compactus]QLD97222.1 ATP synthase F0 subunit 8 [Ornithodoros compactus]UYB78265.1 ATP synthase F0 subunit 8 [Ornithodoros compactus]